MTTIASPTRATAAAGRHASDADTDPLLSAAREALDRATEALLSLQKPDGHWCAELEGDSILNSEYTLMKWILRQEADPRLPKILAYLRRLQREDGTWGQFPGSGVDVSATVKAFVCLLLDGDAPDEPHMRAAAAAIRAHGGAEACNSFSNFYLAALGLIDWDAVPAIPPEMIFLPRWFYFHLDKVSAWTRTMILPLAICTALRPVRALPGGVNIDHLFNDVRFKRTLSKKFDAFPLTWNNFFLVVDRVLKVIQKADASPLRRRALKAAEQWILDRADSGHTEGLGAIFPPMVYLQVAFHALGYERSHPVMRQAERDLDDFIIEEEDHIRIQPCFSPVWDTGIALYALTECGATCENSPEVARACDWLRGKENRLAGDWSRTVDVQPAGWCFEYRNEWYPDVDDTAMVAMALHRAGGEANRAAGQRGVKWILAMQNEDGGWAAFDKTRDRPILEKIPFADHNAMQDPSCPDITGRVLECLAWHGIRADHPAVQRAVKFIRSRQEPEGCWFGRWGVNYIYGTWQSIGGLRHIGVDMKAPWIQRAGAWLKSVQKPDGSFGESANSYEDPSLKGIGPSTASQTAWAAMTLQTIFGPDDPDLARAIRWLCETQLRDGASPADRSGMASRLAPAMRTSRACEGLLPKGFRVRHAREGGHPADFLCVGRVLDSRLRGNDEFGQQAREEAALAEHQSSPYVRSQGDIASLQDGEALDPSHASAPLRQASASRLTESTALSTPSPGFAGEGRGEGTSIINPDNDPPGSWIEAEFTGTGFPRVFYLRYHLYRLYFPLMALARWTRGLAHE